MTRLMKQIQMFADLICPFAYVVHATWRELRPEYADTIELAHRSLSLEYVNNEPSPKRLIDVEVAVLLLGDDETPYVPWRSAESEWPVTTLPALEIVACAGRQSAALADDLAWAIRLAVFRDSRCISMRHELFDIASTTGIDLETLRSDFDAGVCRKQVIDDAHYGWHEANIPGSPTWVLPSGERVTDFGLADFSIDDTLRPLLTTPGLSPLERGETMRALLDNIVAS